MVKKLTLALSLTALTGLVTSLTASGCSSDDSSAGPSTNADAGDAKTTPDGGDPDGGDDSCPKNVELTAAQIDEEIGWKKATPAPGSCSQADLTQLEANFKDDGITSYFDLGKSLSDPCKSCVFAKDTDPSWGPIVGSADDNGATGFINFGACFGAVEGESCGKALQYEQLCYNVACNDCAKTTTERQSCVQAAGSDGMCKSFGAMTVTACPDLQNTAKKCSSVLDGVKSLCGSAGGDGGAD